MDHARAQIRAISLAINIIDGDYTRAAKKIGLRENELSLLYALDDGLPHSQAEVSKHWLIPKTTLNSIVRSCIKKGYITLLSKEPHGKQKQICLTKAGQDYARRALDIIYTIENAAYEQTLKRFSAEFGDALSYFAQQLHAQTERLIQESGKTPPLHGKSN